MRPYVAWLGVLCLAACTSDNDGSSNPGPDGSTSGSSGSAPGSRPSGALVRVFNAYAPLNGEPGPVDLYSRPFALEGATPKLTVPYGTMSELFDPTVSDEAGDMFLSIYWAGTTGNGSELISKTETLKGGEVITFFLTTGPSTQSGGRRFGASQTFFHQPKEDPFAAAGVPTTKGLLMVDTVGLEEVLAEPSTYRMFFGIGTGCYKAVKDTESSMQSVGPGTGATFAFDPGRYSGTVYNDPNCAANPIVQNVPFEIAAGGRSMLFVYAPKENDFRAAVVPLEPKQP